MKYLLIIIISCICFSCYNTSNSTFIEKQIDKEIQLTNNLIATEINTIQKAFVNGVGKMTKDVYSKLFVSSEKVNSLYLAIIDSSISLKSKKEEIITYFSEHLELIFTFLQNDARKEKDSLTETLKKHLFEGTLKQDGSSYEEFINDALSNQDRDLNIVHFKLIFLQVKHAEYQMWQNFKQALIGIGATMNKYKGFIGFDEKTILLGDTVQGTIFCDAYGTSNVMTYYLGEINWAMFGENKNLTYQAGDEPKIPIIGEYQTIKPEFRGKFFHAPREIGMETIEGVIEINSALTTFYVPFVKNFQVHKKVPEYFLSE